MREITTHSSSDQRIVVFALAIFVCVFLGPFNTGADLSVWDRVVFWTAAISSVGIFMELCIVSALNSRWLVRVPIFLKITIGSSFGSVPGTSFVIVLNKVFRPEHLSDAFFPMLWFQVTIMGILIAGLELLIDAQLRPSSARAKVKAQSLEVLKPARLMQRLPTRLREAQIVSMSMQDHYVEVTTTLGNEMLLMRLSDAIDLLDGMAGVQTHRSHWAARNHAQALSKVARRHELTLSDGRSIPVSSSYKDAVTQMLNEKEQT